MPWGEIALAALGLLSALIGYLRGGGKKARERFEAERKTTKALEADRDDIRTQLTVALQRVAHLEAEYVMLKRKHNETLTDYELRVLAGTYGVGGVRGGNPDSGGNGA